MISCNERNNSLLLGGTLDAVNSNQNTPVTRLNNINECGQTLLHTVDEPLPKLRKSDIIPYESYAENFITVNQPDPPNEAFITSNSIVSDTLSENVERIEPPHANEIGKPSQTIPDEASTSKKKPSMFILTSPSFSANIEQIINRLDDDEADNYIATSPSLKQPIIHGKNDTHHSDTEADDEIPLIQLIQANNNKNHNSENPSSEGKHKCTGTNPNDILQGASMPKSDGFYKESALDADEKNEYLNAKIKLASSVGAAIFIETCRQWVQETGSTQLVFSYITGKNSLTKALCDALKWDYDTSIHESNRNQNITTMLRRYAKKNKSCLNEIFGKDNEQSERNKENYNPIQTKKVHVSKQKLNKNETCENIYAKTKTARMRSANSNKKSNN